jgi:hypothetical protein
MALATRQLRRLIIAKGECLKRKSNPLHPAVCYFDEERARYIEEHGLATYVSEMLGDRATVPLRQCVIVWPDGRLKFGQHQEDNDVPIQDWIKRYWADDLPYCIEIMGADDVMAKYL